MEEIKAQWEWAFNIKFLPGIPIKKNTKTQKGKLLTTQHVTRARVPYTGGAGPFSLLRFSLSLPVLSFFSSRFEPAKI